MAAPHDITQNGAVPQQPLRHSELAGGTARAEWRAHWPVAVTASIGVATGFTMLQYNTSQFIQPWQDAFGWSRGEIAAAHNGMILVALLAPAGGMLLDRFGVRVPLLTAMILTVIGYCAMTLNNGNLVLFYASYLFVQMVGILTTGLAFTRVIAERFHASCGLALALSRIGISVVGLFLPSLLHLVIADHGWQAGFLLLAGLLMFIGFPVCWFGIRSGQSPAAPPRRATGGPRLPTRGLALLCAGAAFGYAPITAVLSQLHPLLMEHSLSGEQAAMLIGLLAGSVIVGVVATGLLLDRIWGPLVACIITIPPVIGIAMLATDSTSFAVMAVAVAMIGIAQGAEIDLIAYLVRRYHPLSQYSRVYGVTILCTIVLGVGAQIGIAVVHDVFGNYRIALGACVVALIVSAGALLLLGPYPQPSLEKN
ncbi:MULTISPECIES: MFS transporter [unclassified Sphingobium]|uniref:MFS transporter n=1 Tax=unclassified Sphingobium TaxID=2611147 RepID=UPI00119A796C|nr:MULTISPECIES: MFS transporter [unclassified Sphingobium]TWC97610.1 cyanate permease [Sphingobium sp. AEW010]TWD17803.1 cyanate permease [Sphingobium sp. AEW013]TWD20037.1 cyanate permease [Sphingobium sp. AEW001]